MLGETEPKGQMWMVCFSELQGPFSPPAPGLGPTQADGVSGPRPETRPVLARGIFFSCPPSVGQGVELQSGRHDPLT